MKRTMDLIGMFDSDTFAGPAVRLFDVANSRPSDLWKDLIRSSKRTRSPRKALG